MQHPEINNKSSTPQARPVYSNKRQQRDAQDKPNFGVHYIYFINGTKDSALFVLLARIVLLSLSLSLSPSLSVSGYNFTLQIKLILRIIMRKLLAPKFRPAIVAMLSRRDPVGLPWVA